MRRATSAVDPEADTPRDAAGSEIGLRLVVGFLVLSGLGVLGVAGGAFYAERRTAVRGEVVAHRIVPANTTLVAGSYEPKSFTAPERHVLRIRTGTETGAIEYDVPASFWRDARDGDRVARENGVWRIDRVAR